MKNDRIHKLVWAGLFTALTTVATMIIIPVPVLHGYANGGDALVIVSAFLLGPVWGAVAAGLGSALSDLLSGFIIYSPATLIIKALMALAAGAILRSGKKRKNLFITVLACITAELIMIAGYFAFDSVIYGVKGAIGDIAGNGTQAIFAVIAGTALFYGLTRIPYVKKNF
ncbi:MAG: ECF transporter S component [Oscillospiraceae bacterium]